MPLHYRLEDLPERFRRQAEAALRPRNSQTNTKTPARILSHDSSNNLSPQTTSANKDLLSVSDYSPSSVSKPELRESKGSPNATEAEFNRRFLNGNGRYEAITFRLPGGSLYTPDWFYFDNGVPTFVECKGSFRFASQGRSATAFRESAAAFPFWNFVWATKKKGGSWDIKRFHTSSIDNSGRQISFCPTTTTERMN